MVVKIKMEGMLYHWALVLQEYNFEIEYNPGSQNANADALFAHVVEFPKMNHVLRLAIKYHIACQEIVCIRHREMILLFLNCENVCQTQSHLLMQLLQLYRNMFNCGHSSKLSMVFSVLVICLNQ